MFNSDIQKLVAEIKYQMFFVPEYFFAKHPANRAPIRILVNRKSRAQRSRLGDELRAHGFVVRYWTPKFRASTVVDDSPRARRIRDELRALRGKL